MQIRLASDIQRDSIVDGEGIRAVLWTQGCGHHCPGCQNPFTWDFDKGMLVDIEDVLLALDELEGQDGITFSGGDPVYQSKECAVIAKYAKSIGLNVWCYTGFLYEDMLEDKTRREFLNYIDVLVDGKFILKEKSLSLYFKGSRNQRIIDVAKSLAENKVCLVEKYKDPIVYEKPKRREENIYI